MKSKPMYSYFFRIRFVIIKPMLIINYSHEIINKRFSINIKPRNSAETKVGPVPFFSNILIKVPSSDF